MNTQLQGALIEQKCFLKCIKKGYIVSKPLFDNARYDFILDTGEKLLKIQVKSSRWNQTKTGFSFNGYSQHSTGNGNKRMKYTSKEVDYFMTEFEDEFYLYPVPEEGISEKTLKLGEKTRADYSYAQDYLFEEVSKDF